ncbi:MAG TPA: ABC transporter permease, partial [Novosphingobium sp.]
MPSAFQDLRYALRVLRKSRAFTAAAVIVLALGIGANTAIFSVVNSVLLRPLPYADESHLVMVYHRPPQKSFPGQSTFAVSPANYLDWRAQNHSLDDLGIVGGAGFTWTGGSQPESLTGLRTSASFFRVLGVRPLLGRAFTEEEDAPGSNAVMLSYKFWKTQMGANPGIIGQSITLDGAAHTVVGIMPQSFRFMGPPDVYAPLDWDAKERSVRGNHNYLVIGRLKAGVDMRTAQVEMDTISRRLEQEYPDDDSGWGAVVIPMREDMVGQVRPALLVLLGAVVCVLLIACANVANLVLARTLARRKEIAIRTALGASRARLLAQVMWEALIVSLVGGAFGVWIAAYGTQLITRFLAGRLPRSVEVRTDGWVL